MIPLLGPTDPFPAVETALDDPDGLLAAGGGLSVARLVDAYSRGIFPWFGDDAPILWWSPDPRTVLAPRDFRVSRSLGKRLRRGGFRVSADEAFGAVLDGCAAPRRDEPGTWLGPRMRRSYTAMHARGLAHSIEVWMDGELAGGLYGVSLGRMFFGESMFARRTDASKIGLACLSAQLERWGFPFIDCQQATGHLASLGARPMRRARFVALVANLVTRSPPAAWRLDEDVAEGRLGDSQEIQSNRGRPQDP